MNEMDLPITDTATHTTDTPQVLLEHHLKELRLPTILREYDRVARQCAVEQVNYPRYLVRITELELLDRERRATDRRIRQAKFPVVKSLDSFDFLAIASLNKNMVLDLADLSSSAVVKICSFLVIQARVRRTSPWLSAWLPASVGGPRGQVHVRGVTVWSSCALHHGGCVGQRTDRSPR